MAAPETLEMNKTVGPLAGVLVGWFLKETSDRFKETRDEKRVLLRVITELLELRHEVRLFGKKAEVFLDDMDGGRARRDHAEFQKVSRDLAQVRARIENLLEPLAGIDPFLVMTVRRVCEGLKERGTPPGGLQEQEYRIQLIERQNESRGADELARKLINQTAWRHGLITYIKVRWEHGVLRFGDGQGYRENSPHDGMSLPTRWQRFRFP